MARELKGYALKNARGLVPHQYDKPRLRGVYPPVMREEAARFDREALARARFKAAGGLVTSVSA
jgi:hypothetical protein